MTDFVPFAQHVHNNLRELDKRNVAQEVFTIDTGNLFETYLAAFPEGTNPIFRTRSTYDCACCKQFIRNLGGLVFIENNRRRTIWEGYETLEHPFNVVAKALHDAVMQQPIKSVYKTVEGKFGAHHTYEHGETVICWNHFHGNTPGVAKRPFPDRERGEINTTLSVGKRALNELTNEAIQTVIDLINSNSIYRGAEFARAVGEFKQLKDGHTNAEDKELFIFSNCKNPAMLFRNTAIGSLVVDLSEGVELEAAVRKYEAKVAPENYKRPTAIVTPKMIEGALEKIDELGLTNALPRRFAKISDISVNDVLFVDTDVRGQMRDALTESLMSSAKKPPTKVVEGNYQKVTIDEFLSNIVPGSTKIEALIEGSHLPNFVSLTSPAVEDTGKLFKWNNDHAWSYDGEVTDSIRERVKKAGGSIDARLRVSLSWSNYDDLDLHAITPNREEIYFGNKRGILDVDMNAGTGTTREPVENLAFNDLRAGVYSIYVNQFSKRENHDVGFTLEVEYDGQITQYNYEKAVAGKILCLRINVNSFGKVEKVEMSHVLTAGTERSTTKWNVPTHQFVPVSAITLSPNHWKGDKVGNKHWFFFLKDCKNPEPVRGIYNEFLRTDLDPHRKVFELISAKTKCEPTDEQLSGVGFSSTKPATLKVKVDNRPYEITF